MDLEAIIQKVQQSADGMQRSVEVSPGAILRWPSQIIAHHNFFGIRAKFGMRPTKEVRAKHARDHDGYSYTFVLDLQVPPSALLQHAYDCMISDSSFSVNIGIARCNPLDQFSKSAGRIIAVSDMEPYLVIPEEIRRKGGRVCLTFGFSDENENLPLDLAQGSLELSIAPNSCWLRWLD